MEKVCRSSITNQKGTTMRKRTLRLDKELVTMESTQMMPEGGASNPDESPCNGPSQWPLCSALCTLNCSLETCYNGNTCYNTGPSIPSE